LENFGKEEDRQLLKLMDKFLKKNLSEKDIL